MKYIKNYNRKNSERFVNESIKDQMVGVTDEEMKKIFKEKYDIDYIDIQEVVSELEKEGVECKIIPNPYEPIEITEWSVTRVSGSQGWGIGSTISKKLAQKVAKTLQENMEGFWKNGGDEYKVEKDRLGSTRVNHEEALIILSKLRKM
jgi:hypothetical protein